MKNILVDIGGITVKNILVYSKEDNSWALHMGDVTLHLDADDPDNVNPAVQEIIGIDEVLIIMRDKRYAP